MKIKQLLATEKNWCKGSFAQDAQGNTVSSHETTATAWCLVGAARQCYPELERSFILRQIKEARSMRDVGTWNDAPERTFEEVKRLVEALDV